MAITELEKHTDICNLALAKIGQHQIDNIQQASMQARQCRLHLPQVRQKLLRDHPWNFASRFIALPVNAEELAVKWTYRFKMPSDYMQLIQAWTDNARTYQIDEFNIAGRSFLTEKETVFIEYIADVCDPRHWEPSFTDCAVTALAAALCIPVGGNARLRAAILDELYNVCIPQAHVNNAWEDASNENNNTMKRMEDSTLIQQNNYYI
tara:strand:- start:86 stop:709 length:624 start_codon:yes stop_codon:yes gene_type:complete